MAKGNGQNGKSNGHGQPPAPRRRRMFKKWTLPAGCSVREFVMRELDANDDLDAAIMADQTAPPMAKESLGASISLEQREKLRLAIVEVDGKRVNLDVPYKAMDEWNLRTIRFAERAFVSLNGITSKEVASFDEGAVIVAENEIAAPGRILDEEGTTDELTPD